MRRAAFLAFGTACFFTSAMFTPAAEYFVSVEGDDSRNGLSQEEAFGTIQHAVNQLDPGDVLTIGPGEYHETVAREEMGGEDADILIQAEIPGTVLLRGDVPAPEFEKLPGYRFVYQAAFSKESVQAVNELDTYEILEYVPGLSELEFTPGRFHYDPDAGKLYISTSDLRPPEQHRYSVSVLEGRGGMWFLRGQRIIIDGLAATGFNSRVPLPRLRGGNSISDVIPWGFFLSQCRDSEVRNSTAYLNAGGIAIQSGSNGRGNRIVGCTAYGNHSTQGSSGGNLIVFNPHDDAIVDSYAYRGRNHGIRMHGDSDNPRASFQGCLSWGHGGAEFNMKTGRAAELSLVEACIAPVGGMGAPNVQNSIIGRGDRSEINNIVFQEVADLVPADEFADPDNLDFRLQADSRFRGAGPEGVDRGPYPYEKTIFYVYNEGDDAGTGASVSSAWKTLEHAFAQLSAGDTLYLLPGVYDAADLKIQGTDEDPVSIRGRGTGAVVIRGSFGINESRGVELKRLNFESEVTVEESDGIDFSQCRFQGGPVGLTAGSVEGLRVTHSQFAGFVDTALDLTDCDGVFLQGNIFDNATGTALKTDRAAAVHYSDYNSFHNPDAVWEMEDAEVALVELPDGADRNSVVLKPEFDAETGTLANSDAFAVDGPAGKPVGVFRVYPYEPPELRVEGPYVHSTTATTANLEWWSSVPSTFELAWGRTPETEETIRLPGTPAYHPGNPLESFNTFSLTGLEPGTKYHFRLLKDGEEIGADSFTTLEKDEAPRTLHVAPDGDNGNSGLDRAEAWRTINHAAAQARPGDTVLVHEGTYHEFVRVRATGEEGAPVIFRSAPGEKVVLDGANKTLTGAFNIANKRHIQLDGFYFRDFQRSATQGVVRINRCHDIRVERCFADGRASGTDPEFITTGQTDGLVVRNCVIMGGWDGIGGGNVKNLRIENNVFIRPSIRQICLGGRDGVEIRNNIITDNLAGKFGAFLVQKSEEIEVAGNCFFLRAPEEERRVFGRGGMLLADYEEEFEIAEVNLVADPLLAGTLGADGEERETEGLFQDGMMRGINDFPDAFATNPELVERGIGLDPAVFADFHFHAADGGDE